MNANKSIQKGKETTSRGSEIDRAEIARRAYELWEANGRPTGRDMEYWLQAEAGIAANGKSARAASKPEYSGTRSQS